MVNGFEVTQSLLGPYGGQLAIAFGAGCAAGYAFCLRTVYKMLVEQGNFNHAECNRRIGLLEDKIALLEDRLYTGTTRQMAQMRESEVRVLGVDRLGRPPIVREDGE